MISYDNNWLPSWWIKFFQICPWVFWRVGRGSSLFPSTFKLLAFDHCCFPFHNVPLKLNLTNNAHLNKYYSWKPWNESKFLLTFTYFSLIFYHNIKVPTLGDGHFLKRESNIIWNLYHVIVYNYRCSIYLHSLCKSSLKMVGMGKGVTS